MPTSSREPVRHSTRKLRAIQWTNRNHKNILVPPPLRKSWLRHWEWLYLNEITAKSYWSDIRSSNPKIWKDIQKQMLLEDNSTNELINKFMQMHYNLTDQMIVKRRRSSWPAEWNVIATSTCWSDDITPSIINTCKTILPWWSKDLLAN